MRLIDAQKQLFDLNVPVIQTADAAICLNVTRATASQILIRLAKSGILNRIDRGLWAFVGKTETLQLPEYITSPYPAYISLQTALYYHGMISQIPQTTYAVSVARTRTISNAFGRFSIHHVDPAFYFGFDILDNNIKMAQPEKALLDIFYLRSTKSLLFKALPEVEIPPNFNIRKAKKMINLVASARIRSIMLQNLDKILISQ